MRCVTLPAWDELGRSPPVLTLGGLLTCDARPGLVALWSWSELHGGGPHLPAVVEQIAEWRGEAGALVSALVTTGWAVEVDGSITLTPWRDLLTESRTERRKRQLREASRRYRAASSTHHQRIINASSSVIKNDDAVIIASSSVIKNDDASSSPGDVSLFSEVLQRKNQKQSRKEHYVVSIPAPVAPAGLTAGGVPVVGRAGGATLAERLAVDPGADLSDLFDVDPVTADERPAVGPGSTIDPEVRSVPVPAPDRAPEGDSGKKRAKRSSVKKSTVDIERVDPSVRAVWAAYASTLGTRVVLSAARVELIAARLADGWTVDDLSTACRGYGASPFHSGDNDRGQRYQAIELWLRDAAHVEQGLALARSPPAPKKRGPEPLVGVNDYWEDLMRQRAAEQASANGAKK